MVSQKIYGSYEEQLQLRWEIFINTLTVYASRDLSVLQTKLVDDKRKFPYDFKEILAVILPSFVYVCPFSIISTHPRVFQLPLFQITVHCNFPVDHSSHTPEWSLFTFGVIFSYSRLCGHTQAFEVRNLLGEGTSNVCLSGLPHSIQSFLDPFISLNSSWFQFPFQLNSIPQCMYTTFSVYTTFSSDN